MTAYDMGISDWSSDVCSSDLAAIGVDEALAGVAQLAIALDRALDRVDDAVLVEAGAGDLGLRRVLRARSAEQELVIFGALAVEAQDTDVPRVVVATGVDAAGNLDLEFAAVRLALHPGQQIGSASGWARM